MKRNFCRVGQRVLINLQCNATDKRFTTEPTTHRVEMVGSTALWTGRPGGGRTVVYKSNPLRSEVSLACVVLQWQQPKQYGWIKDHCKWTRTTKDYIKWTFCDEEWLLHLRQFDFLPVLTGFISFIAGSVDGVHGGFSFRVTALF